MIKIPGMFHENKEFELTPGDDDHWHIRIKEGEFIESIISFGNIKIDEKEDSLKFDFTLHSSPDPDLTPDNTDLQWFAGKILESIMIDNLNKMENE